MNRIIAPLFAALCGLFSLQAPAATVTVFGTDVSFTYDDATLFGSANVIGNSIFFLPTSFRAQSDNGAGAVTASATLNIEVKAITPGYAIDSFLLQESGDYLLSGASASVSASGRLQVTSKTTLNGVLPFNDAQIFNVGGLTTQGAATNWSGSTGVDLGTIAGWGSDTNVIAQIQNNLSATTLANGETAWIQKKSGAIGLVVNPVPVPGAVWLFGSGLLALVGWARRR